MASSGIVNEHEVRTSCPRPTETNKEKAAMISYEEIATKLLNERLLLTALELHAELCEADRELPILKDFFSNPNNFECLNIKPEPCLSIARSGSQATLDSLDMTRFSEDGGGVDERVAVLEFELRKAKENINSLRANLTVVTESEVSTPEKGSDKSILDHPIRPHEKRALNFLVNEYLLANLYKLTSITFSDENDDQDFEDWQDVGLNIPKPPELIQVYREFMRSTGYDKPPQSSIAVQTDEKDSVDGVEKDALTKLVSDQEEEIKKLKEKTAQLESMIANSNLTNIIDEQPGRSGTTQTSDSNSTTPDKFELLESPPMQEGLISQQLPETEEDDSGSIVVSIGETEASERDWTRIQYLKNDVNVTNGNSPSRQLPTNFRREVLKLCLIETPSCVAEVINEPLKDNITRDNIAEIMSYVLPRLVPNIVLNKREEVIALILSAIKLHANPAEREKLYHLLFGLQKRPQDEERHMILAGLSAIARLDPEPSENEEVLNLCWEYSQHKYPEQRILAAECCATLALYTTSGVRNSLMISMLQQMLLDDQDASVRCSVIKSLALLVALMDDSDKYFQCEELALTALDDVSDDVVEAATTILIPILAQWALSMKRLQSHLLPRILTKLKSLLKPNLSSPGMRPEYHNNDNRALVLIEVMRYLLPHTIVCTIDVEPVRQRMQESVPSRIPTEFLNLCTTPLSNPKIFHNCDVDLGIMLNTFLLTAWDDCTWLELDWIVDKLIFEYIEIMQLVQSTHESVMNGLLTYLQSLCTGFGKYITQNKIAAAFKPLINSIDIELSEVNDVKKLTNVNLVPAYLTILTTLDSNKFTNALKQYIISLARRSEDLSGLETMVVKYCAQSELQELVLSGIWDGVVYDDPRVKCATASILGTIISKISDKLVDIRIAPAVVTLSTDSDLTVKAAAIPLLGKLITECDTRDVKDKARGALESILRDPSGIPDVLIVPLILAIAAAAPYCPQSYLEDVIATQLTGITASTLQKYRNVELANALVEAYSVIVYCNLSNQCMVNLIAPGLKYLDNLVNQVVPLQKDTVRALLREVDSKKDTPSKLDRSASMGSGISLSMASVNVGQGVEDMRQRMSKMFHQKTTSPSMPSIFRKKT
ncbi:lisH domain and HEAT repeat-containing protein KIAA1468 homolog [Trichogramma pretiosum]|uniref:lisH domain and HEAT repeat-containing protein KIAA1468 homolog n=1 Tax=Trichogramma pretiosum TaxID=7493 RepID=UPI0006C993A7|nr:lisH domain and HEAT repeat-containing protein KIAA1468 homolog [Trichogramma pretiosum]